MLLWDIFCQPLTTLKVNESFKIYLVSAFHHYFCILVSLQPIEQQPFMLIGHTHEKCSSSECICFGFYYAYCQVMKDKAALFSKKGI